MTKAEFKQVFEIANNFSIDLNDVDSDNIHGYALPDFQPINVTAKAVAKALRHHALQFDGNWSAEGLDEFARWGKRAFIIVG